jgi:hypothetical protein
LKSQAGTASEQEDDMLHFVRSSSRQRAYRRRRPWVYDLPPPNHRKARAQFGKIAHDHGRGEFGTREIVDKAGMPKEVPSSAVPIMERMAPVKPAEPVRAPAVSQAERLRRIGDILAAISEST